MSDLSTHAGQAEHYREVRARLDRPKYVALLVQPRVIVQRPRVLYAPFDFLTTPSWRNLLRFVSLKTGVSEDLIMGRQRDPVTIHARFMTMTWMRRHLGISLPMVAARWGMDHSSAFHGIEKYESGKSLARANRAIAKAEKAAATPRRPRPFKTVRWTVEEIAEAQAMREDGMLLADIGKWFGVSEDAVQAMLARQRHNMVKNSLTAGGDDRA